MSVLTCWRTRRRIGAYLDGALEGRVAEATATHLTRCATCGREADELRRLHTLLQRHLAASPAPDWTGFWPAIVRGIQDAPVPRQTPARRRLRWQPRWALGAVAIALAVSLGVWQFAPLGPTRSEAGVVVDSAHTEDPRGTVVVYSTPEQDVAVVWVVGLDQ